MKEELEERIYKLKSIYKTFNMALIEQDSRKVKDSASFNHYTNTGGHLTIDVDYLAAKKLYDN